MKICRLAKLEDVREGHFLKNILPGAYLCAGGMGFSTPGRRSHTNDGPDGRDFHVDPTAEAFVILQGKARMELNGKFYDLVTGDIFVVEPGEDHHLISDRDDPCVTLALHAGPERHPKQCN